MRITRMVLMLGVLAAAAGCDETPVSLPEPAGVAVAGNAMTMAVGDEAPVAAQVVDQNGRPLQGAVLAFSTDNPGVATVGTNGLVRGITPGTANVTAAYGASMATVRITVIANRRNELQTLDVLADSVVADVRAGPQVVTLRAVDGRGQSVCPGTVTVRSSDASVATASADGCRILVTPQFPGEASITVTADGLTDGFRVRVTSQGVAVFFSERPEPAEVFAGNTVTYRARLLDEAGNPVAGRVIHFDVTAGALSATSLVTDAEGRATVQWTLPTDLQTFGRYQTISLRTQLPSGVIASRSEQVYVNSAELVSAQLYWYTFSTGWMPVDEGDTISARVYQWVDVAAGGTDQYGNPAAGDFTFSVSPTTVYLCTPDGYNYGDGFERTCMYSSSPLTATFTATAGSITRTFKVQFTP